MRRFDAEYLTETRRGMWDGAREALTDLELPTRERIVDVGCGTGELTRVLRDEAPGATVIGVDADRDLLARAAASGPVLAGDALALPVRAGAVDLVVCQALLINLPDPVEAVREFARVSSDLVAAIEPDNAAVTVDSSVPAESALAARAREAYLEGVETDVALGGAGTREAFEAAGVREVATHTHNHVRTVEPPYSEADLEAARRKASGESLAADRATVLAGGMDPEAYDALRADWRAMGREAIEQMREGEYRRREVVPFYVTVGRV